MNSKVFMGIIVFLLLIIISFGYLYISKNKELSPTELNTDKCEQVIYNGGGRMNLLFISSKQDAIAYSELMFNTEPYKTYKNYFNIHRIDGNPECESYKGIAILCNTKAVKELERNCPHDYTIVVKDESQHIRSSAYANRLSLNRNVEQSVFIHELGHLFNLAEEYLSNSPPPRGSKNCQASCDKFGDLANSCSQECSQSSLYRSIGNGVMRSLLTTEYGAFNKDLISKALEKKKPSDLTITGNQISNPSLCSETSYTEIKISDGDLSKAESTNELIKGCIPTKSFLDTDKGVTCFNEHCYNLENVFTETQTKGEQILSGEIFEAPKISTIAVPLTKEIIVSQNGQQIATISTAQAGATACLI